MEEEYQCTICNRSFGRKAALKRHVDFDHASTNDTDNLFDEEKDDAVTVADNQIKLSPKKEVDNVKSFDCDVCGKTFKNAKTFSVHRLAHGASDPYSCPDSNCSAKFKTKAQLRDHLDTHAVSRIVAAVEDATADLIADVTEETEDSVLNIDDSYPTIQPQLVEDEETSVEQQDASVDDGAVADETGGEYEEEETEMTAQYALVAGNTSDGETVSPRKRGRPSPHVVDDGEWATKVPRMDTSATVRKGPGRPRKYPFTFQATPKLKARSVDDDGSLRKRGRPRRSEDELVVEMLRCKVCQEVLPSDPDLCEHLVTHLAVAAYVCERCDFVSTQHDRYVLHMQLLHKRKLKVVSLDGGETGQDVILEDPDEEDEEGQEEADEGEKAAEAMGVTESDWTAEQQAQAIVAMNQLMGVKKRCQTEPVKRGRPKADSAQLCPACDKPFANSTLLRQHLAVHTGTRNYECHVCFRNFLNEEQLTAHLDNHPGLQQFQCNECNRVFKLEYRIREHMRVHTNERPFLCSQCGKAFKSGNTLRIHLLTHTDQLPYECNICQRRFRENGTLTRHMRTHTGEKPFVCRFCGRAFAVQGALARHLKQAKVHCPRSLEGNSAEGEPKAYVQGMPGVPHFHVIMRDHYDDPTQVGGELLSADDGDTMQVASDVLDSANGQTYLMVVKAEDEEESSQALQMLAASQASDKSVLHSAMSAASSATVSGGEYVLLSSSGDRLMLLNEQTGEVVEMMQQGFAAK